MPDDRRDRGRPADRPQEVPAGATDVAPDTIFDRFVRNAYAGSLPVVSASAEPEARWVATVEELLDDAVTEVGARPVIRVATPSEERELEARDRLPSDTDVTRAGRALLVTPEPNVSDTDVTRAATRPRRPGDPPPATVGGPAGITARHRPLKREDLEAVAAASVEPATSATATARHSAIPLRATPQPEPTADRLPLTRIDPDGTLRVVLLTNRKAPSIPPPAEVAPSSDLAALGWKSLVPQPSTTTQKREALLVVPEVLKVEAPALPMREGSEDGMIPGGELDRKLGDMAVLLRYGHEVQVQREIDTLQAQYPRDLLMLRRIAEFWIGTGKPDHARELLFALATGLFERRNVEGMRQALEQVLVLEPGNERASRLISLLDQRPETR